MNAKRIEKVAQELIIINGNIDMLEEVLSKKPISTNISISNIGEKRFIPLELQDNVSRKLLEVLKEAYLEMKDKDEQELEREILARKKE